MRLGDEHGRDPWLLLLFFGRDDAQYGVFCEIPKRYLHLSVRRHIMKLFILHHSENFSMAFELFQIP
jgi:hypothetical protein